MVVTLRQGDVFASERAVKVIPVNCVGVMGAGLARLYKERDPAGYSFYRKLCARGTLAPGRPSFYPQRAGEPESVFFPTKRHWKDESRVEEIMHGLLYLEDHYQDWRITSLAVPALGCGLGGLDWNELKPIFVEHFENYLIPVDLYAPR